MNGSLRRLVVIVALVVPLALGFVQCIPSSESDLLAAGDPLAGDPIDPETGQTAEIGPGAPWIQPGPDGELGTGDDVFVPGVVGDVDLVVRVRGADLNHGFPPPMPLRGGTPGAISEPFAAGLAIPFVVAASDGDPSLPAGRPVVPIYVQGLPILVLAFADLDGDGFIGRTHLDGSPDDTALETLELYPVGRRYAVPRRSVGEGSLHVSVGAPGGMSIALGAATIAGSFENPNLPCLSCHSWPSPAADRLFLPLVDAGEVAPEGPVVTTQLPFVPDTDVDYRNAPRGLVPAHPDARVGVLVEIALLPDPADPRVGEAFTLPLDGSSPSIDIARAYSGRARRAGLALSVDPATWRPAAGRIVRPGVTPGGERAVVEIVQAMELPAATDFRVVPLDRLGSVAAFRSAGTVTLLAEGDLRIATPDADGDPRRETIALAGPAGAAVRLAPTTPDPQGVLLIDGLGGISRVEFGNVSAAFLFPSDVLFPPDNDGDGIGVPSSGFTLDDDDD